MSEIKKHIVTDENGHPVAVQISYADWTRLESQLTAPGQRSGKTSDLSEHVGKISLRIDPMEYQERVREEWT